MATEAQIIEHLRKLSQYRERPECDSDGMPHYVDSGNMDDAYGTDSSNNSQPGRRSTRHLLG